MADYPHLQFRRHWGLSPRICVALGECVGYVNALAEMPLRAVHRERLLGVALIKGAQATTAIEGNTLTDEEIEAIYEGHSTVPPSREYQQIEVANVLQAMNDILQELVTAQDAERITPALLKRFHREIGKDLGEHFEAVPGQFRNAPRIVGPYRCPDSSDVPGLVDALCDWLQDEFRFYSGEQSMADAVVQAIVTHVYIEWIHPFGDGNGRTGRLVEFYVLLRAGYPDIASHILSNFYNQTRPQYYRKIDQARKENDLTCFIEYAIAGLRDGLKESLRTVQESQFETAWQRLVYDTFGEVQYRKKEVFKRRRQLLLSMPLDRELTLEELAVLTPDLARRYAARDVRALKRDIELGMDLGLLEEVSPGKRYRANASQLLQRMPRRRMIVEPAAA